LTQQVTIQKQRKREISFDLRRTTRRVEIQVFAEGNSAIGAEVSIKGQGESKYIKDENGVSFHLSTGIYTVLVQHHEDLFTEEINIPNLNKNYHFNIDLPLAAAVGCDESPAAAAPTQLPR